MSDNHCDDIPRTKENVTTTHISKKRLRRVGSIFFFPSFLFYVVDFELRLTSLIFLFLFELDFVFLPSSFVWSRKYISWRLLFLFFSFFFGLFFLPFVSPTIPLLSIFLRDFLFFFLIFLFVVSFRVCKLFFKNSLIVAPGSTSSRL